MRIVEQCLERLEEPGPVMVEDPKVRWPAQLEVGPDGIGNSNAYVRHIMEESMEALIHHFKMVTQGVEVPPGEVYQAVESPRGELGFYVVSDGEHTPYRVKIRDPSFVNLQATPIMVEGHLIADADRGDREHRSGDGGRGPLMAIFEDSTLDEARTIIARYPAGRERSAVMPLLYLAQSIEGRVTRDGSAGGRGAAGADHGRGRGRRELLHDAAAAPDRPRMWCRCARTCRAPSAVRTRSTSRRTRRPGSRTARSSPTTAHHAARGGVPGRVREGPGRVDRLRLSRRRDAGADARADRRCSRRARSPLRRAASRCSDFRVGLPPARRPATAARRWTREPGVRARHHRELGRRQRPLARRLRGEGRLRRPAHGAARWRRTT